MRPTFCFVTFGVLPHTAGGVETDMLDELNLGERVLCTDIQVGKVGQGPAAIEPVVEAIPLGVLLLFMVGRIETYSRPFLGAVCGTGQQGSCAALGLPFTF